MIVAGAMGTRSARKASVAFSMCFIWLVFGCAAAFSQTPQEKAWGILQAGISEHGTSKRANAVEALRFLQGDARAIDFAEKALADKKPAVRIAAAAALGQIGRGSSIPLLKIMMADKENRVAFAAADAGISLGDPGGYDLYYKALTGERISSDGWVARKKQLITDQGAILLLGFGYGLRYVPYAGYGRMLWQELSRDYAAPVHVLALKKLASDQDLKISGLLVKLASDRHTDVRMAALAAIANHGDPSLIPAITSHMTDKKPAVRYVAAAAVLKLSELDSAKKSDGEK